MPVKLSVVNEEEKESSHTEHLFDEDRVTIGRAEENHLTLPDPKRIVSSEHAMIERKEGDTYHLVDRGSKNFTYVGNQRITAQEPYELSDGDVFRVGDFRIKFNALDTDPGPSAEAGETVLDYDFSNPFEEPADQFFEALEALVEAYEEEAPQRRDDALAEAVREANGAPVDHDTVQQILDVLDLRSETPFSPASRSDSGSDSSPSASPNPKTSEDSSSAPVGQVGDDVADAVIDTLTDALAEVIPIPWRFRHEFIGQTIVQASETQFLYEGDGSAIKEHLMDPTLSEAEREERLGYVKEAAESLTVHQIAMLNGYKASVMDGTEQLLERLNPDEHQAELMDENVVFEYVPMLSSPATLERLRGEWKELQRGDWSVAEQRIFRPAFNKAYLARMTTPRTADDEGATGDTEESDL